MKGFNHRKGKADKSVKREEKKFLEFFRNSIQLWHPSTNWICLCHENDKKWLARARKCLPISILAIKIKAMRFTRTNIITLNFILHWRKCNYSGESNGKNLKSIPTPRQMFLAIFIAMRIFGGI